MRGFFHEVVVLRKLILGIAVVLASQAAVSQLVVDATVPVRGRLRNPTGGRSGSIGRKLPLQVTMSIGDPLSDGGTEVDFTLTNTGKEAISLPISPHARDFEPADPRTGYRVQVLSLFVMSGKNQHTSLSGRADLYGSRAIPESWTRLAPGESMRVLTRAVFHLSVSPEQESRDIILGHISLTDQTISSSNGETLEDSEELGTADSAAYTMNSLTGAH